MQARTVDANTVEWKPHRDYAHVWIRTLETRATHPHASVHRVRLEPGAVISLHHHEQETETFYVLAGQGIATAAGEEHPCQPGFLLTVQPPTVHGVRNTGSEPLELLATFTPPLV